jgi:hypothetical protein
VTTKRCKAENSIQSILRIKGEKIMNTKIIRSSISLVLCLLVLNACRGARVISGSGNLGTKVIPVIGFSHIVVGGVGELVIVQDGKESLSVETDDNLLQYVRAEVRGDTLHLSLDVSGVRTARPTLLRFSVGIDNLTSIEADGAWAITSAKLGTDSLEFISTGANEFNVSSLTAKDLTVRISGSSKIKLSGSVLHQSINFVGGGTYDAGDLSSETTGFLSNGTGQIIVWATENLTGTLSNGSLHYYGTPRTTFSQTGNGNIQSLGDK